MSPPQWDSAFAAITERFYGPRDAVPVNSATVAAMRAVIAAARKGGPGFASAVEESTRDLERSELVEAIALLGALASQIDPDAEVDGQR